MGRVKIWAESDYLLTNYSYLSKATVANFQNNGKIWILCVDKTLLPDGKKYFSSKAMAWQMLFRLCSIGNNS